MSNTITYTVRLRIRASNDLNIESVSLAEIAGEEIFFDWKTKMQTALGSLATWPRRFPIAPEANFLETQDNIQGASIRVMLFRRTTNGPAWHVFYKVEDNSPDGPMVWILHIRHASSPLTEGDGEIFREI
jgi:hypothetical protein